MATLALILSIAGVLTSIFLIGIIPSLLGVICAVIALVRKPRISADIALGLGILGIILPVFFFINSYGFVNPVGVFNGTTSPLSQPMFFANPAVATEEEAGTPGEDLPAAGNVELPADGMGEMIDAATYEVEIPKELAEGDTFQYSDAYAFCYDYTFTNTTDTPLSASFTYKALNANGEVLASVIDTISGIPAGEKFVTEAVFNKNVGEIADVIYEVQTRPCGEAVYATDLVDVTTQKIEHGERVEALNRADTEVRVNVHVLFYRGTELVQNSWVVPANTQVFSITPGTTGTTEAICRAGDYTHVEVYYGALRVDG